MAHHQDAIKRIKQNAKRRARNRHFRTRMRTQVKRVREAIEAGNADEASAHLRDAISLIHRVASKGVIHRNQASRKISRLNLAVKNLSA